MSKTPFQMRMDDDLLERLRATAAKMQMSKTEIIEAALVVRLDLLDGYVKLDTAPPKVVKPSRVTFKAGVVDPALALLPRTKHPAVKLTGGVRSIKGYAVDGTPIYR